MEFHYEKLDHVQLAAPANSEETARQFYRDLLGFKEIEKPYPLRKNGGVWFRCGNVELHIGIEDPFSPAKKAHPAIRVKHLSAMKLYLDEQGYFYTVDKNLPNAERFYLSDPFGNRIEFLEWR